MELPLHPRKGHWPTVVAPGPFIAGVQPPCALFQPFTAPPWHWKLLPGRASETPCRHSPTGVPFCGFSGRGHTQGACVSRGLAPGPLSPAARPDQRWALGWEQGVSTAGRSAGGAGTSVPECPYHCLSQCLPHHHWGLEGLESQRARVEAPGAPRTSVARGLSEGPVSQRLGGLLAALLTCGLGAWNQESGWFICF